MKIQRRDLLKILGIFILTRCLIYIIGVYSYSIFPERGQAFEKKSGREVINPRLVWDKFDSGWYQTLAAEGYPDRPFTDQIQETWGFMPLYPILMRGLSELTGWSLFSCGLIMSNICTFLALLVMYRLFEERYSKGVEGVTLLLISAGSFYLSIVYTEGLFVLLTALVFYLSHRKLLGWALIAAGLASVTRIQGCLLFVIPGLELLIHHRRTLYRYVPAMLGSVLPMIIFMWFLYETCGEPLAFIKIQHAWGSQQLIPLQGFWGMINGIRPGASFANALFWIMILTITLSCYRKLPLSYLVFTVLYFLLSTSNSSLYGSARYMLGIIPVFAAVSLGSDRVKQVFIMINLMFLTLLISDFVTNSMTFL